MAKGPKQPRTKREILAHIITLALGEPYLVGKEIRAELKRKFPESDIPGLRTVQQYAKNAREQSQEMTDDQPWSLALHAKVGIPDDPILLDLLKLWFGRQVSPGDKAKPPGDIGRLPFEAFPVGLARWAVRLHRVAPHLSVKKLLFWGRRYFTNERIDELSGVPPFSSVYDDLEIAMANETNQELIAVYEHFYGLQDHEFPEREVETQPIQVIEVPSDIAEIIFSNDLKE